MGLLCTNHAVVSNVTEQGEATRQEPLVAGFRSITSHSRSCLTGVLAGTRGLWLYPCMHTNLVPFGALVLVGISFQASAQAPTDDAIRRLLIEQSVAAYGGNCPCPYNTMRNGRSCGGRSAWSRPGGASPLCYPEDVFLEDIAAYRARHGIGAEPAMGAPEAPARPTQSNGRSSDAHARPGDSRGSTATSRPRARPSMANPEPQPLPDCPPGTSLARWNGQTFCVGSPETLAKAATPTTLDEPSGRGTGRGPVSFGDVLSRLQALSTATGEAMVVPASPTGQYSSVPAMGLLDCAPGTRPTHTDGRMECR